MDSSGNLKRVQTLLDRDNKISVKVGNLERSTFRNMDQLIHYTLQFYKMEFWFDYFSILTRSLLFFTMDSCHAEKCSVRFIKKERSFGIQVHSNYFKGIINKRKFIEYINDLSDDLPEQNYYTDLGFLKKMFKLKQIEPDNISYSSEKLELNIPDKELSEEKWIQIRDSVISSIESLPPLKENLIRLEEMLHAGSFDMNSIALQVGTDAALTMDILKIVNSGAYVLNSRIENIQSALKFLGLRELYNLLITLAIKKVLTSEDRNMNDFWQNSYKCAYYASHIALKLQTKIAHTDSVYTAALLHDIGKFPLSVIFSDDDTDNELLEHCKKYKLNISEIEDALSGIHHCETGFLMAEKWNLPDSIKLVMRFHHEPASAPEGIRNLNDIVYLADCLVFSENGQFDLSQTDLSVLKRQGLSTYVELSDLFSGLKESFENNRIK